MSTQFIIDIPGEHEHCIVCRRPITRDHTCYREQVRQDIVLCVDCATAVQESVLQEYAREGKCIHGVPRIGYCPICKEN